MTCRSYDCRVFAAAGIAASKDMMDRIIKRAMRWRFSYPTRRDWEMHSAVKAAAVFIRKNADCFPAGAVPKKPGQAAILAIKVYEVFLIHTHLSKHADSAPSNRDNEQPRRKQRGITKNRDLRRRKRRGIRFITRQQ